MNALTKVIARITPPPFVAPVDYDGLEFRWRFLAFRPAYFKIEAYLLGFVMFYVLWAWLGKSINRRKVDAWVTTYTPLLQSQFACPLINGITADGSSDFFTFSTGRRNIEALHTVFTLRPRHDLFQYIFQFAWGLVDVRYNPVDEVQLDFTLNPNAVPGDFVWAAVAKSELRDIKKDRWDLSFTRTSENPILPTYMSLMSEYADVTDAVFKTNIAALLADPAIQPYFRSLSITDQPRVQPDSLGTSREKHLILSLTLPSSQPDALTNLFSGLFGVIDSFNKFSIRPETKSKLKKARETIDKELKEAGQKERKEEAAEDKRAAKRKADEEKLAKLSAAEQAKFLEKERKKNLRKSQGKMVRK